MGVYWAKAGLLLEINVEGVEWLKVVGLVVIMLLTLSARLLFRGLGRTGVWFPLATGLLVFVFASPESSTKRDEAACAAEGLGVRGCGIGGVAPDVVCEPELVSVERAESGSSEREE
jgi:hypothetical protein